MEDLCAIGPITQKSSGPFLLRKETNQCSPVPFIDRVSFLPEIKQQWTMPPRKRKQTAFAKSNASGRLRSRERLLSSVCIRARTQGTAFRGFASSFPRNSG